MPNDESQQTSRSGPEQEAFLIILVCAVALIAMLSVFVPPLRHLWLWLGGQLFG